jgi:hypothetical protein
MITIVQLLENMDEKFDLPFVAGLHFEAGNRLMVAGYRGPVRVRDTSCPNVSRVSRGRLELCTRCYDG